MQKSELKITISKNNKKIIRLTLVSLGTLLFFSYFATVAVRAVTLRKSTAVPSLSAEAEQALSAYLDSVYSERESLLNPLPYKTYPATLDVLAESAIAVETKTGCVLYEKNADKVIPPASMTKIFVMNEVFNEIDKGLVSLADIVPLPPESWACNMPPHSSLMFLGENQVVTLNELMIGLAVCSGNDAAYAVAYYISGGMDAFIARMNETCKKMGLLHTHFVESSGYSEKNTTTAREMAAFARHYVDAHPESLALFHSRLSFKYPDTHNLAPEDRGKPTSQDFSQGLPKHITMGIYQKNTNPLLGAMDGCDGLKTGYIEESGYNLALTAVRENMRILSVTMGGPGASVKEGNAGRVHDGTEIIEWAFSTFENYENPLVLREYSIPLLYGKKYRRIHLIPAFSPKALCVPKTAALNSEDAASEVKISLDLPEKLYASISAGEELGSITYSIQGHTLQKIPLVASATIQRANFWLIAADFLAQVALKL